MNDDKAFAIYACTILAGITSVIGASVVAGFATLPGPLVFLEHLAMSLAFRAAYHSFAGPVWWPYPSVPVEAAAAPALAFPALSTAGDSPEFRDAA